ncbi:MAG TPA: RsmG family class I SAM-dependent methyltransferase [Acidimicrobiales bacterium]|jgi:hypothetical protein|nr:RsmG family class I SAM-dependent methyltransferase [Acidimicrobiales bacterium]
MSETGSLPADLHVRRDRLVELLRGRQARGDLGPAAIEQHLAHSLAFAAVVAVPPSRAVDLGTGGGVPGLVLAALCWPSATWSFIESRRTRAAFLREAVGELDLGARVEVLERRAEEVGHDPTWRAQADLVTARSFAKPAVVAECAAPLLRVGGHLVVSEPPAAATEDAGRAERWPARPLRAMGLGPAMRHTGPPALAVLELVELSPPALPRRVGEPARTPRF